MKKILLAILCIMAVLVGTAFYYVSSIDKEEIKAKIESMAIEQFPNAIFKIGKLNYDLGFKVTFQIDELEILNKKTKKKVFKVNNLKAKIPILNILTKSGTIDLLIDKPEIVYREFKNSNNISSTFSSPATGKESPASKDIESDSSTGSNLDLDMVSLDVDMNEALIIYNAFDKSTSKITINELKLKNVGSHESVVYEALLKINQSSKEGHVFTGDLQLVGDANLKDILFNQSFFSKFHIDITNMFLGADKKKIFDFRGNGDLRYVSDVFSSNFNFKGGELLNGKMSLVNDGKSTNVNDVDVSLALAKLGSIVDLGNLSEKLNFNNSKFMIKGGTSILENGRIEGDLKFSTSEKISFKSELGDTTSNLSGYLKGGAFRLTTDTQIMGGNIGTEITLKSLNKFIANNTNLANPIKVVTTARNLNLTESYIQEKLYSNKVVKSKTVETGKVDTEPQDESQSVLSLPATVVVLKLLKSKLGKENISIDANLNLNKNVVDINKFDIQIAEGTSNFNGDYTIGKVADVFNLDLSLNKMDLTSFRAFLPSKLGEISGYFSGKTKGQVKLSKETSYSLNNNFKATEGEIKELNIGKYMEDLFSNDLVKKKISEKDIKFNSTFDHLDLSMIATQHKMDIKNISFVGDKNSANFKGSGFVGMSEGRPSELILDIKDNRGKVRKAFNTEYLPVKLVGDSFILKPKLSYTTKKLTKNLVNNEKKKIKTKVKAKIEKEKDKLKDKLKEKAGKLLKGLF